MAAAAVQPDPNLSIEGSLNSLNSQEMLEAALMDLIKHTGTQRGWCHGEPITESGKRRQVLKMMLLIFLPTITLVGISCYFLYDGVQEKMNADETRSVMSFSIELGRLVHTLQAERDQSVLYLSAIGPETKTFLFKRYLEADDALENLSSWPVNLDTNKKGHFREKRAFQKYLVQHRNELELINQTVLKELGFYTDILNVMMRWLYTALKETKYSTLWKAVVAYQKIVFCKEDVGLERALGGYFFSRGGFSESDTYDWFNRQVNVFRHNFRVAQNYSPLIKPIRAYEIYSDGRNLSRIIESYRDQIQYRNITKPSLQLATSWFDNMTLFMDILVGIQNAISGSIFHQLDSMHNTIVTKIIVTVVIIFGVLLVSPLVMRAVVRLTTDIQSYALTLANKTKELNREKRRTDSLLYQMMPRQVAEQLKLNRCVTAEYFKEVTIFFSDIVGFTRFTSELSPMQIVRVLNELFMLFDERIEQHDVYKVETIGDSYMVASGLPTRNGNRHAYEIANMSLDLLSCCADIELTDVADKIQLRIGLHTGPVVTGVVGSKLPRYCVFGDTVNTASRMETNGHANRIHVSQTTNKILAKSGMYILKKRGPLLIKGKGQMITYWLYGHCNEPDNPRTCVEDFKMSPVSFEDTHDDDAVYSEEKDVGQKSSKKSMTTKPKKSEWVANISADMTHDLPSYEDLEKEFCARKSPPIVQLTEGYHY